MDLRALFPASLSSRQPNPDSSGRAERPVHLWRRAVAGSLIVLLVPFASVGVFAQSGYPPRAQQNYPPPPPQGPPSYQQPQEDYPPPPPDYSQPQTGQPYPQPYPQQQGFPQQPYPDQSYDQQAPPSYGAPDQQPYAAPEQQQPALAPDQLDQLVAPIALNPDGLIAQMLAASTYPEQVAAADHWRQSMGYASPAEIAAEANAQPWDPSVKGLTAFPQVLAEMDQNLSWTIELGNAYYNQPQDVFGAIQEMRQRAQASGNLQSNPQEEVTNDQGYIGIAPANPQVVYVPSYNPWNVYGAPINPWPGFSVLAAVGEAIGEFGVRFGPGLVMSAFTAMPWGWLGWGLSWLGSCLSFDDGGYYPHGPGLRDWGLRYGGPRAPWARNFAYARAYDRGFNRGYGRGYGRGAGRGFNGGYDRGMNRGGMNRGYGGRGGYQGRGAYGYNRNRGWFEGNRGFASSRGYRNGFVRNPQQAWNRGPAFNGRSGYGGYGSYGRTSAPVFRSGFGRPSAPSGLNRGFGNSYRQPQFRSAPSYRAYSGSSGYGSRGFSQPRSFGGGHSFFGGRHSQSMPRSSGHSFGGGEHSFFGGGGHSSFGGGHSFHGGGGHSFGGGGHSFGSGHGGGRGGGGHVGGGHHR